MKKRILAVILLFICIGLVACGATDKNNTFGIQGNKNNVSEFAEIAKVKGDDYLKSSNFDECYNITAKDVSDHADCQIFKFNDTCESYLLYKDEVYHLGMGFGGYGIIDMKSCDFDKNGQYDLVYSYSWGSGLHHSSIGCFDLAAKAEIPVKSDGIQFDLSDFKNDMLIEKQDKDRFVIYQANIDAGNSFTSIKLTKGKYIADVIYDKGEIKLINQK